MGSARRGSIPLGVVLFLMFVVLTRPLDARRNPEKALWQVRVLPGSLSLGEGGAISSWVCPCVERIVVCAINYRLEKGVPSAVGFALVWSALLFVLSCTQGTSANYGFSKVVVILIVIVIM